MLRIYGTCSRSRAMDEEHVLRSCMVTALRATCGIRREWGERAVDAAYVRYPQPLSFSLTSPSLGLPCCGRLVLSHFSCTAAAYSGSFQSLLCHNLVVEGNTCWARYIVASSLVCCAQSHSNDIGLFPNVDLNDMFI